jgi:hypothetical protein
MALGKSGGQRGLADLSTGALKALIEVDTPG